MKIIAAACLALAILCAPPVPAAPADDIADALARASSGPITADSLPEDFARLARFVRHDANGMILFTDGGPTDGYVRHAQAHFDLTPLARKGVDKIPLFAVEFELADQPDFTFEGLSAALERRFGNPSASSDQPEAVFRTWLLKEPAGRTVTLARAHASDNGDPTIIFYLIQNR
jgi:hypothetical protein